MDKKEEWERLAQGLLEYETLTGEEINRVIRGEPPDSGADAAESAEEKPSVAAIPKTKPKSPPRDDGGMEPEPT